MSGQGNQSTIETRMWETFFHPSNSSTRASGRQTIDSHINQKYSDKC